MGIFEVTESNTNLDKKELCTYICEISNIDKTKFSDAIKEAIMGILIVSGDNDIIHDSNDLKFIMEYGGIAFVGTAESNAKGSATKVIQLAIKNSSLNFDSIDKIAGFLIYFVIHPDFPINDIIDAVEIIYENAHDEADIIWGTTTDESISKDYVKAIILLTGFKK